MFKLSNYEEFIPKTFTTLKNYCFALFKQDLLAGITVGAVALPLAMAFAMASGVEPERGLFTAIVAGFIISFLGGSRVLIGGPTGAFVVVVYSTIVRHGYEGLVIATLLAGVLLIAMGVLKLGNLIKLIPYPLVVGFTTGIALIVFSSQVKDLLGLQMQTVPTYFLEKWQAYFKALPSLDVWTSCVGIGVIVLICALKRFASSLPWGIISIIVASILCAVFHLPVDTLASRFGALPTSLPAPVFHFDVSRIPHILPDAITIALLAGVESLLCAVLADSVIGGRHRPNCELIAQGIANIGSAIFGGIPATAAIARTATNIKTGAKTPIAGMIHAVMVLLLLSTCSSLVGKIPLAALSGILVVISWQMSDLKNFFRLMRTSRSDVMILIASFLLTVLLDLTVAVQVGMVLAAFFFMKRMSDMPLVEMKAEGSSLEDVQVFHLKGPFFFGVADQLKTAVMSQEQLPQKLILNMALVPFIDATALQILKEVQKYCESKKTQLVLMYLKQECIPLIENYELTALLHPSDFASMQRAQGKKPLLTS
ncbi:MAG: SulP family inorganic anion transporter [Candidatus Rhabdochlamydia sp.]